MSVSSSARSDSAAPAAPPASQAALVDQGRPPAALDVRGLTKRYPGPPPVIAVDAIELAVAPGELFGLLGPNGAGKTTTVGMCTTQVVPTAGRIVVDGIDVVEDPPQARRRIGVVTQHNTLDRQCTVRENIELHCRYFGASRRAARSRATSLLDRFRLSDRADARPDSLSGGMARRLQLARAIAHRPAVLFLDEPTSGLDPQSRIALWELLEELHAEATTVVLTTHYMEEADRLCERVAIVDHGRMLICDTPAALKRRVGAETVVRLRLGRHEPDLRAELARLDGVSGVCEAPDGLGVSIQARQGAVPEIAKVAQRAGLVGLSVTEPTLETVFIELTGRALRD